MAATTLTFVCFGLLLITTSTTTFLLLLHNPSLPGTPPPPPSSAGDDSSSISLVLVHRNSTSRSTFSDYKSRILQDCRQYFYRRRNRVKRSRCEGKNGRGRGGLKLPCGCGHPRRLQYFNLEDCYEQRLRGFYQQLGMAVPDMEDAIDEV